MTKSIKQMFIVVEAFALVMLLGTVTYAFFNYTRTGAANTVSVGRISFVTRQTKTISLTNLFPIDPTDTEAMADATKVGTVEIEIEGDTDYVDGVEYLVSSENTHITTSTGKTVPISLDVSVTNLGTPSNNYFTAREDKNATIYKKLVGDTLVGDQMLLVGFIKPNTTSGTADGIDGSITIKAYLDENKILISDTYEGTESDNMGTPNSMAQGKTVLTTTEWNALQNTGLSFKVKVEANEGIWVNGSLEAIMKAQNLNPTTRQPIRDDQQSTHVTGANGIDFGAISSDTNGKGIYMRAGTENDAYPILYYRGAVEDNNVVFANKCWKIVRTTDTGGVKLIYNGENTGTVDEPACENIGEDTHINISGTNTFAFNTSHNSPAYVGYMYGDVYTYNSGAATSGAYYGSGFTYNNGVYTLTSTSTTKDATHHYTCNLTTNDGTCATIRYYFYNDYYVNLTGGDGIEEAMTKMQTNTTNSNAKDKIDTWYASNMTGVTNKLEDTIWCNDRSVGDGNNNGWIANGGDLSTYLYYGAKERSNYASNASTVKNSPSLACTNKNDSFTVSNEAGNKALTYPVALLTEDEMVLAGGLPGSSSLYYLNNGSIYYWSMSPYYYDYNYAGEFHVNNGYISYNGTNHAQGLRPSISLKPGTPVIRGDGTVTSPYIIGN